MKLKHLIYPHRATTNLLEWGRLHVMPEINDVLHNLSLQDADRRILVVRDRRFQQRYNDLFLKWIARNYPSALGLFELRRLPTRGMDWTTRIDWEQYGLFVPWLQDPLKELYPDTFEQALKLEKQSQTAGVKVINSVSTLSNAVKSTAQEIIRSLGMRAPISVKIGRDASALDKAVTGLGMPFIIRDNWRHTTKLYLIENRTQLSRVPLNKLLDPIAMEFIDVQDRDGYYRKYRYILIGNHGIAKHMMTSRDWVARASARVRSKEIDAEELDYINNPDPNHAILNQARKAFGFDIVAFDYSYDKHGNMVVWEPNPFPVLEALRPSGAPCADNVGQVYDCLLRFYLERAGVLDQFPAYALTKGSG